MVVSDHILSSHSNIDDMIFVWNSQLYDQDNVLNGVYERCLFHSVSQFPFPCT
jgi:hypothetical protein